MHEFDRLHALKAHGHDIAGKLKWRNKVIEIVTTADRSLWEPYHPAHEHSGVHIVNHDGIQFNVKVEGNKNGPVVAFANPLGFNLSIWDQVVAPLASHYRIIRHDQRGHGRTSQSRQNTTFTELVNDLVAILDCLGIKKLHVLIGCSMGAIVSLDFGLRFPERVGKIIPCDCQPSSTPDDQKAWDARIQLLQDNGIDVLADQSADRWFTKAWKQNPANATTLKAVRNMVAETAACGFISNARAMHDYDYVEKAKNLKVPCLLVCGAQDPPLASMRDLEKVIPGASLIEIENCGHLPMIEQTQAFVHILKNAL